MADSIVYLVTYWTQLDKSTGNYKGTRAVINASSSAAGIGISITKPVDVYIPIAAGNITVSMTREPVILPIPVLGISAAIDYNVRRTDIIIEGIILADGTSGGSILGALDSPAPNNNTKGWIVDGQPFTAGGSPNLNDKEVQRALFSRAVGLTTRDTSGIYPIVSRIVWGDVSVSATPDESFITSPQSGSRGGQGDYSAVMWANVIVTKATIKEVAGEPTKYECSLELKVIGFGGSDSPFG